MQGTQAFFGTYSVADKALTFHVDTSTWPAWTGTDQKRSIIAFGKDELTIQPLPLQSVEATSLL